LVTFRSGFVAIIGRTNVGKSTLFNSILGQKVSIVSEKRQTTRNRILGIHTEKDCQIVFIDTPGIHRGPEGKGLNRFMIKTALAAKDEADITAVMIEAGASLRDLDREVIGEISALKKPAILLINKIDTIKKTLILPLIDEAKELYDFSSIIPLSALRGEGVKDVLDEIRGLLPEGPAYFPEDALTDQSERSIVAEIIREKVFALTRQEIPYSAAVTVEDFKEDGDRGLLSISATIFVEKESQKGIVIGRGGSLIKRIGSIARLDIEALFDIPVFLDLRVKVMKDWAKNEETIKRFGYK
jgi:GTP-binding protein Era